MIENKKVLITGPTLHPEACKLMDESGIEPIYMPPYSDSDALIRIVTENNPIAILVRMGIVGEEVIRACQGLKVISKHGAGVDNIDLEAAAKRGIPVVTAYGANAKSVAEHAIAMMLALDKNLEMLKTSLVNGQWLKPGYSGSEIAGKTLGLVGYGAISRHMGTIAKALEMNVRGYDPFLDRSEFAANSVRYDETVEALLSASDVVSLHCPLTADTRHLINKKTIALMKPGSVIINTARGGLIDEAALLDALATRHIAAAGLDTFEVEPPAKDHPLFTMENVVVTPHIAGVTEQAAARVGVEAVNNILKVLNGDDLGSLSVANRRLLLLTGKG